MESQERKPPSKSRGVIYQCDFCSRSFKRKDRLEVHLKVHTGDRPYICGVPGCYSSYTRLQHLQRHIERVHFAINSLQPKLECPNCDALLANPECLKRHEQRFHSPSAQGKSFKCPEEGCCEMFRKKSMLIAHREQDHAFTSPNAARCHKCPFEGCGKSFPFPTVLRRHMKVHQGYPCEVDGCGEVFENYLKLRKHKAVDHGPDLVCRQCQTSFKSRQTLVQHLKTHLFVKEVFACTESGCERTFLYKKNLTQHIRSYHLGERVFIRKKVPKDMMSKKNPAARTGARKSSAGFICGVNDRAKGNPETPLDLSVSGSDEQDQNPSCSFEDILHKFYPPSDHSESSSDTDCESDTLQTVKNVIEEADKLSKSVSEMERLKSQHQIHFPSESEKYGLQANFPIKAEPQMDYFSALISSNSVQENDHLSVHGKVDNLEQETHNLPEHLPMKYDKDRNIITESV